MMQKFKDLKIGSYFVIHIYDDTLYQKACDSYGTMVMNAMSYRRGSDLSAAKFPNAGFEPHTVVNLDLSDRPAEHAHNGPTPIVSDDQMFYNLADGTYFVLVPGADHMYLKCIVMQPEPPPEGKRLNALKGIRRTDGLATKEGFGPHSYEHIPPETKVFLNLAHPKDPPFYIHESPGSKIPALVSSSERSLERIAIALEQIVADNGRRKKAAGGLC